MSRLNSILILLMAFLAVYLEATLDVCRNWLGAQIDILPVLMVYTALTASFGMVIGLALAGGLWFDSLSANPLGLSVMPLFIVGLLIYAQRDLILREQSFAQIAIGLAAGLLVPALSLLLLLTTRATPLLGWATVWQLIVMSLSAGVLTPACFWAFGSLQRALNYRPLNQTSFRADREIRRGRS
jgi:cell shape-determining protein MreD